MSKSNETIPSDNINLPEDKSNGTSTNPFLDYVHLSTKTRLKKVAETDLRLMKGDEVIDEKVVYAREKSYDRTPFVKVYFGNLEFLENLTKIGIKVFIYLLKRIKVNQDIVIFDVNDFCTNTGYKNKSKVYGAITELENANVVARHAMKGLLWINPSKIYSGERRYLFINLHNSLNNGEHKSKPKGKEKSINKD